MDAVAADASVEKPVITRPAVIWSLPPALMNEELEIRATVRINFYDPEWRNLWVEDSEGPGFFNLHGPLPNIIAGQKVLIEGKIVPAQGLDAAKVKVTVLEEREKTLPMPAKGRLGEILALDQHRVVVEALVDYTQWIDEHHTRLYLISENRTVIGWLRPEEGVPLPALQHCYIRFEAVYSSRVDPSGTLPEVELWIARPADINVVKTLSTDPAFNIPATPLDQLLNLQLGQTARISGEVQGREPVSRLVIRDGYRQVTVETLQDERFPIGTEVEVVGNFTIVRNACSLRDAIVRRAVKPIISEPATPLPNAPLLLAEAVRRLTPEDAARGRPVKLAGVVTWTVPEQDYLFMQDVSGPVRVQFKSGSVTRTPFIGSNVTVEGRTFDYGSGAGVDLEKLSVVSAMRLPSPRQVTYADALSGAHDGEWVEIAGFLRSSQVRGPRTDLNIITPAGEFDAMIQTPEELGEMRNALISFRGVCESVRDSHRHAVGFRLWIPYRHNLVLQEPAPPDLFDTPQRSIASVWQLSATNDLNRSRVEGIVTLHLPGQYLFLQQDDGGLLVESRSTVKLSPGDRIEAVGLVGRDGGRPVLRDAVYRKLGNSSSPVPMKVEDPAQLQQNLDGRLVALRGVLINQLRRPGRTRFTIQSGDTMFEAWLEHPDPLPSPREYRLETGLELTGVYRVVIDDSRQTRGFQIQLRSPEDINVFRRPRLLTVQRALWAALIAAGGAMAGIAWAIMLRRRVRQQTEQIREQLHKEVVLEERHRSIVENASDFIFTTDLLGNFMSFNPAGERLTGYTRDEVLAMNIRALFVPQARGPANGAPELFPESDGTVTYQSQLRTKDGRTIWIETSSRLIKDSGSSVGVLGIARDISERKQIEEALKNARDAAETNTRSKSEFLANMSHEIRTPMNAVIGMTNLLLDTNLNESQRDFAETIRNGAETLLTVLNDILDFSKMEAGRMRIERVDFDLRETIDATIELLAAHAVSKGLELTAFIPTSLPCAVRGDPGRLRQVLLNMLGNAVKFTERGEVCLQVSVEEDAATHVRFLFEIIDTGLGLTPEEQARLFRPFTQADSSTTRRFGGTGLGLAISKQIIGLMDGSCGVRSKPGEGSTFWFTASLEKRLAPETNETRAVTALQGRRVLLVDDSSTSRRLLKHYATTWNMPTEEASNAEDALRLLRNFAGTPDSFSVAIIDAHLSDIDGLSFAKKIREESAINGVRLILLYSIGRAVLPAELEAHGAATALLKPVRLNQLLSALLRVVSDATCRSASESITADTAQLFESTSFNGQSPPSIPPATSLRVLVAEDNAVNQRVALLQLQKLGHRAKAATNGREVLEALDQVEYDVILMDCHMPEMDGFEATRLIRTHSAHSKIHIIALTANAMQGDRDRCIDAGMDDYLSKPVRMPDLLAALAKCPPRNAS
jgi:PAS domain S-box-containing protein